MIYAEEEYKGHTIKLLHDEDAYEHPRQEDNLGQMICFHDKYNLGDEHDYRQDCYYGWQSMKKDLIKGAATILPLYLLDHSVLRISASPFSGEIAQFDSRMIGFIRVMESDADERFGKGNWTTDKLLDILLEEIKIYNAYLTHGVLSYSIEDEDGVELEGCTGYFTEEAALEAAREMLDDILVA
jgi:hypothetical protein